MNRYLSVFALLFAAALRAQDAGGAAPFLLNVDAGSPVPTTLNGVSYTADQGFTGGFLYGPANQADAGWKSQTGIYSTVHYCASCSADYVVPNGTCAVQLRLIENRPAISTLGVAAAAIGARVFTVTINGVSTGPIDIFAAAGAQTPYSPSPITVPVTNNHLHFDFLASAGNAVEAAHEINCSPTPPVSVRCTAPVSCPFDAASNSYAVSINLPQGYCGSVALCVFADHEVPSGSIDGVNTVFTVLAVPAAGSEEVFLNGRLQSPNVDYTISGNVVTFKVAPSIQTPPAVIQVNYRPAP